MSPHTAEPVPDYLNYLKWTEPIALMLSLPEVTQEQAWQLIQTSLDIDLMLGARLAGEVHQDRQQMMVTSVVEEAKRQEVSSIYEIQLLGNTRSDYAVPILLTKLTNEENQNLVFESAIALRELGSRAAIPKLLLALEEEKPFIATIALFILGRLGNEEIIPDLQKALCRPNDNIREQAIVALSELGTIAVVPDLLHALTDESYKVREKAAEALGNLRSELAIPELLKITLEDQSVHLPWTAAEALKKIHQEQATEELLKALKNENYKIRERAAEALGKVGSETAIDGLIETLEDGCIDWQAARALIEIGSKKALPELFKALERSVPFEQAAFVLGKLGDTLAVPKLISVLNHWYPQVRERAVEALEELGDTSVIPRLYELLQDGSNLRGDFRKEIIVALGKLGDERVRSELLEMLKNQAFGSAPIWPGQWQVFEALERIGGQPVVQAMSQAIGAKNAHIRFKSVQVLGNLGDEAAIDSLLTALVDENSTVRYWAAKALGKFDSQQVMPKLSALLVHQESSIVREAAVQVLGYLEDESAVTALLDALSDPEPSVRYDAARSLAKLSHSKVRLHVVKALSSPWKEKLLNSGYGYLVQEIQKNCSFYNYEIAEGIISPGKSIALYFSFAPSDSELQTQLANHLNLLERQAIITSWHHRQMLPGDEPTQIINDRLNAAHIILLLISADSIADHTCYDIEINRAMERHQAGEARVIPILLRPVDWTGAPFSQLPMLPKNHQPVTTWRDRDAAFQEIAEGIREVAIELRRTKAER